MHVSGHIMPGHCPNQRYGPREGTADIWIGDNENSGIPVHGIPLTEEFVDTKHDGEMSWDMVYQYLLSPNEKASNRVMQVCLQDPTI